MCSFRATTLLARPSPHSKTSRARRARWGRVRERFANEVSVARSGFVSTTGAVGRPVRMPVLLLRQAGESCDLFHFLQGQDTRLSVGYWSTTVGPAHRRVSGLQTEAHFQAHRRKAHRTLSQLNWDERLA